MAEEKPDQTLQATAPAQLTRHPVGGRCTGANWNSRGHFFGAAAEAMLCILVERARQKHLYAGGDWCRVGQDIGDLPDTQRADKLIALDEAGLVWTRSTLPKRSCGF